MALPTDSSAKAAVDHPDSPDPVDAFDKITADNERAGVLDALPPGPQTEIDARQTDHGGIKRSAARTSNVDADLNSEEARTDNEPKPSPRTLQGYESKWAAGYTKTSGKTVAADGLVSRNGYRRILPENDDSEWLECSKDYRLDELEDIAKQIFHGRNATVFEALFLAPLRGESGRTVEDLAGQFGATPHRIYKIKNECKSRVIDRLRAAQSSEIDHRGRPIVPKEIRDSMDGEKNQEKCGVCGRVYAWTLSPACSGRVGQTAASTRPECLRAQQRAKELDRQMSDYRKKAAEWRETHRHIDNARWNARYKAEREALRAEQAAIEAAFRQAEAEQALFGKPDPNDHKK